MDNWFLKLQFFSFEDGTFPPKYVGDKVLKFIRN